MSGGSGSAEDRTESATQRHLDQARESGNVPLSREAATFASLAAAVAVLAYGVPGAVREFSRHMVIFLAGADQSRLAGPAGMRIAALSSFTDVIPVLAAAGLAGAAAVLLQTNFLLHLGALQPRFSRVNPAAGLKRLFGTNGLVEISRSLGKLGFTTFVLWLALRGDVQRLLLQADQDLAYLPSAVAAPIIHVFIAGLCAQALFAAIDVFWVRRKHMRDTRMSKQEVRDENKDTEGNPLIKARIRRIRYMRARRRMMTAVPKATVVVTNPTHYAVALLYDRTKNAAPRVVAKGVDLVAARIRELARQNNVPVVANPPLARALYQQPLDTDIPLEHYKAVAEIIAYVWRLRGAGKRPR
jgi:flagellar biosynthesis protein FlhB